MVPQQTAWLPHKGRVWRFLHTWTYMMTAITTAISIDNVRNWHSTQSCAHVAIVVRWPWQWWCTHSLHSVSVVSGISWKWSDENTSIDRNTANKTPADICLQIAFTNAKLQHFIYIRWKWMILSMIQTIFVSFILKMTLNRYFPAITFGGCLLISYLCRKIERYAKERI